MGQVLILGDDHLGGFIARTHLHGLQVRRAAGFDIAARRILVSCVVVCTPGISDDVVPCLIGLRASYPLSRVLLVTALTPEAVDSLRRAPELLDQVVWLAQVQSELRRRVEECMSAHFLERATEAVRLVCDPPPQVVRFIEVVWTVPRPPSTVKRASGEASTSPSAFRDHWRELTVRADPKDFVDWGLLGRAVTEWECTQSWGTVSYRLGVHRRTLDRIAKRRLGISLCQVESEGTAWVIGRFNTWLSAVLETR